ncbi:hypothetical protein BASA60_007060 [Batrachochytrium salamandrivorans]|nr:hypothetical protein BASA60_007060 [Batrachochytrium salamandrivorans]
MGGRHCTQLQCTPSRGPARCHFQCTTNCSRKGDCSNQASSRLTLSQPLRTICFILEPDSLSRDPVANQAYRTDPYVHPWTSIGTAVSILQMGEDLATIHSKTYSLPVYITHGTIDGLTCPHCFQKFFDDIPSKDKTYKILEGYYHEAHQEPGELKQVVIQSYVDWILARL